MKGQKVTGARNARPLAIDLRRALNALLIATLVVPVMMASPNSRAQAEQIRISAITR